MRSDEVSGRCVSLGPVLAATVLEVLAAPGHADASGRSGVVGMVGFLRRHDMLRRR